MLSSPTRPTPRRARLGVSLLFFSNGVLCASLLPRYPEVKAAFGLGEAAFGLVVVAFAVGSILAAGAGAPLLRRLGTRRVTAVGSLLLGAALAVAGASGTVTVFVVALVLAGVLDAVVDAAQNVQGLAVERWYGRSIINSLHALWSLGAATGGLVGAGAAVAGVGLAEQMLVGAVVWGAVAVAGSRLARVPDEQVVPAPGPASAPRAAASARPSSARRLLLPLVLLAVCGTLVEDVANNWVVLFLGQEAGAPMALAGLGVSVVLVPQFVGRLLGDRMTDRWGRDAVARTGGLLVAAGALLAVASPGYGVAMAGFALVGFGCATLVPAAFAAADRVPGLPRGAGVALLGWLMRLGFLLTSPTIGLVAAGTDLRVALGLPVAAGLLAAGIAHARLVAVRRAGADLCVPVAVP
jgi:MFS family permease